MPATRLGAADAQGVRDPMDATLQALVEENLPLVKHVVYQVAVHFPRHVDREELARAGALGLVEAAQRYDESRGVPFTRFAAQRIRGAILDAVRRADWAPRSLRRQGRDLEETRTRLAGILGRTPTTEELAAELGVPTEELRDLQSRITQSVVLALDYEILDEDDDELTLGDVLTDPGQDDPCETLEQRELQAYVVEGVKHLPDRHREVVVGHFFEGKTDDDLAEQLNVTKSRISQLRTEALERLREGVDAQYDGTVQEPMPAKGRVARRKAAYAAAIATSSSWHDRLEQLDAARDAVAPRAYTA